MLRNGNNQPHLFPLKSLNPRPHRVSAHSKTTAAYNGGLRIYRNWFSN